ncbi:peptidase M23 [Limnohabitans sp. 2KL-1]|jgi:murein DD-endopeptidase MepM/ murein hydrolase activator NlpD|uniref:M23 family metallopeptidase n=1 Tax=Limnohabitans sp. 2KL-1 TaxID=1100699 RepID=UPI000D381068|nr:M23 family metallopeptidase [Limnohabitans sp. 2KL-1]PUE50766.1 peptidase M23 [Limnohabitans sp. 2KL-1]
MSIISFIQSKLMSLLMGFMFLCTAVLGTLLLITQRALDWLDGQHPQVNHWVQASSSWLMRHPKTISATLASLLLAGAGGAFAIANLGPDIADQPVVSIATPVEINHLESQAKALDLIEMQLTRTDSTRSADTPESLLRRLGLVDPESAAFLRKHPLAKLALQQAGRAVSAEADNQLQLRTLTVRWLKSENDAFFQRLVIKRTDKGLQAALETSPMNTSIRVTGGTVSRSLYDAADEARLPDAVINQLAQIFSNQIDFHRTLRKGARFSVVYEVLEADGEPLRTGRVLSAEFNNDNQQYEAVWFQEPGQKGNYYDMEGKSLSRAYLAAPVAFSRKTSGFSMRLHPIFQTMRAHQGVDYAAPTGTPAQTVGDGVIEFAGVQGGFGNMVIVNHGGNHSTVYAHLSRIQVRKGQTVQKGQVVGAVGSTGWSTGPHLHFEFRVNGAHVDPQKIIQQAQSDPISPAAKARFNSMVAQARTKLQAAAQMRESSIQ